MGEQAKDGVGKVEVLEDDYTVEPDQDEDDAGLTHVQESLRSLRGAGRLALFRKKPTWCAGFLTTIELDAGEEIDLAAIKRDWGGGDIQFRPQRQTANGVRWAPGGRTLRFTGPPRENGLEITPEGYRREHHASPPTVVVQQDRPVRQAPGNNTLEQLVVMLVDRLTARPVAALPPVQQADPMEQLGKYIAGFKQLERFMGHSGPPEDVGEEEPPAEDVPPWLGRVVEMALDKLENKKKPTQAPAPTPAAPSWRLHKTAPPAARPSARTPAAAAPAAPTARSTVRGLLDAFRQLDPAERMELLGTLSGELDPELIREYMAANFRDEGEAVGS